VNIISFIFSVYCNLTDYDAKSGTFNSMYMLNNQDVDVLFGAVLTDSKSENGTVIAQDLFKLAASHRDFM
jgi:hypothetical protein